MPKVRYICTVCGHPYENLDDAIACERQPGLTYQFKVGDELEVRMPEQRCVRVTGLSVSWQGGKHLPAYMLVCITGARRRMKWTQNKLQARKSIKKIL